MILLCIITQTMEYLEDQRIKLMGHPAYSLDLNPCDFWLFAKIKEQLHRKNSKTLMNFMLLSNNIKKVSEKKISTSALKTDSKEWLSTLVYQDVTLNEHCN